jgi:hypothetical protein
MKIVFIHDGGFQLAEIEIDRNAIQDVDSVLEEIRPELENIKQEWDSYDKLAQP